ncbi:hypothetical protein ACFWDG_19760, partial [Peribacillus sp. NPDC060186]
VKIIVPLKRVCLVINYSPFILSIFEYMHDKGKLAFYIFLFVELTGALAEDRGCLKAAFSLCNYRGRLVKEPP